MNVIDFSNLGQEGRALCLKFLRIEVVGYASGKNPNTYPFSTIGCIVLQ
jgi:hypothetical protein